MAKVSDGVDFRKILDEMVETLEKDLMALNQIGLATKMKAGHSLKAIKASKQKLKIESENTRVWEDKKVAWKTILNVQLPAKLTSSLKAGFKKVYQLEKIEIDPQNPRQLSIPEYIDNRLKS